MLLLEESINAGSKINFGGAVDGQPDIEDATTEERFLEFEY